MKQRSRIYYTETDKALMWDRWQKGESLNSIARLFDRHHSAIRGILVRTGGIRPAEKRRSRLALTQAEREEISRGVVAGRSLRSIAASLGRAPSTVSREINRNGGRRRYRANDADQAAWDQAHRPQTCKLVQNRALARIVASKLQLQWAPRQIAGWLKYTYPHNENFHVSHETIYLSLFVQTRGVLKKALIAHLRRRKRMRRPKLASTAGQGCGRIIDAVSIRERPAEAEDRAVPGHWEGDLLSGARNSHIATLVERQSRFVLLVRLPGKDTTRVVHALSQAIRALPEGLMVSLTWDRGLELAAHKTLTVATQVQVYFCDPQSPWQRGTNENTNRLLRQYFPKGTDLSVYSQADLNRTALQLNQRPRKTLDFRTPAEVLNESVASTG